MPLPHLELLGDVLQTPGANTVRTFLLFNTCLESDAEPFAEVALRHGCGRCDHPRMRSLDFPVASIGHGGMAHFQIALIIPEHAVCADFVT